MRSSRVLRGRLAVNANVTTVLVRSHDLSILQHIGICVAADEAVYIKGKTKKITQKKFPARITAQQTQVHLRLSWGSGHGSYCSNIELGVHCMFRGARPTCSVRWHDLKLNKCTQNGQNFRLGCIHYPTLGPSTWARPEIALLFTDSFSSVYHQTAMHLFRRKFPLLHH